MDKSIINDIFSITKIKITDARMFPNVGLIGLCDSSEVSHLVGNIEVTIL